MVENMNPSNERNDTASSNMPALRSQAEFFMTGVIPACAQPEGSVCSICTEHLAEDVVEIVGAYGHMFHAVCILTWLSGGGRQHRTCPNCRCELYEAAVVQPLSVVQPPPVRRHARRNPEGIMARRWDGRYRRPGRPNTVNRIGQHEMADLLSEQLPNLDGTGGQLTLDRPGDRDNTSSRAPPAMQQPYPIIAPVEPTEPNDLQFMASWRRVTETLQRELELARTQEDLHRARTAHAVITGDNERYIRLHQELTESRRCREAIDRIALERNLFRARLNNQATGDGRTAEQENTSGD